MYKKLSVEIFHFFSILIGHMGQFGVQLLVFAGPPHNRSLLYIVYDSIGNCVRLEFLFNFCVVINFEKDVWSSWDRTNPEDWTSEEEFLEYLNWIPGTHIGRFWVYTVSQAIKHDYDEMYVPTY